MIFIGTAGYSYADWRGPFYPAGLPSGEMLSYYARCFSFVEINSSYYQIPHPKVFVNMLAKTSKDFLFVVKAHQDLTHSRRPETVTKFLDCLEPLQTAGQFAGILLQFPFSFKNNEDARRYLLDLGAALGDIPKFVEFRHDSWIHPAIFQFLGEAGLSFVSVDQPRLRGLLPQVCTATSTWAYVRFHGRNASSWWNHKEAYERYDYLYTEAELLEWVPKILELARRTEKVFVSMNNHYQGKAVLNARMLREMLKEHFPETY